MISSQASGVLLLAHGDDDKKKVELKELNMNMSREERKKHIEIHDQVYNMSCQGGGGSVVKHLR